MGQLRGFPRPLAQPGEVPGRSRRFLPCSTTPALTGRSRGQERARDGGRVRAARSPSKTDTHPSQGTLSCQGFNPMILEDRQWLFTVAWPLETLDLPGTQWGVRRCSNGCLDINGIRLSATTTREVPRPIRKWPSSSSFLHALLPACFLSLLSLQGKTHGVLSQILGAVALKGY